MSKTANNTDSTDADLGVPVKTNTEEDSSTTIQSTVDTLVGPFLTDLIDEKRISFALVLVVTPDGQRKHVIYVPTVNESMSPEEVDEVTHLKSTGQFNAAIHLGQLHGTLSSILIETLKRATKTQQ